MSPRASETIQRRANAAWVSRQPVSLALKRLPKTADGAGGKARSAAATLPAQRFRIAATARQHDMTASSTAGEVQGADWLLIGRHDADVETGDWFEHEGRWWRVKFVDQRRVWRTAAGVVEHGDGT